jgi:hypothetical protein
MGPGPCCNMYFILFHCPFTNVCTSNILMLLAYLVTLMFFFLGGGGVKLRLI